MKTRQFPSIGTVNSMSATTMVVKHPATANDDPFVGRSPEVNECSRKQDC